MKKNWDIKTPDQDRIKNLAKEGVFSDLVARLLVLRGIDTVEAARAFFNPSLDLLHDPFAMAGMGEAVNRIMEARKSGEEILVFGDYDVDGTTAVSLVYSFLKKQGVRVKFYIPDRYTEGYGISKKGIDYARENNIKLIIALDCGIKSVDLVSYAKDLGIDFIICDHHLPGEKLPEALAILDPKQSHCQYPYKELSGCGIGYKLIQALTEKMELPKENLMAYLDLVVISIAADIVPITGENRILAHYGLRQLNSSPRPGIEALMKVKSDQKPLSISDLVFVIGPRINAAGRMKSGKLAVELLIEENPEAAINFSAQINQNNNDRREQDQRITEEALNMIRGNPDLQNRKSTVVWSETWHKGVVGIVASRLIEKYFKPTIVLTVSNGMATGSARSVPGYDVYEAIEKCSDLLEQFGGHKYAAGLTLKTENLESFRKKFESVVSENITPENLTPCIHIDAEISTAEATLGLIEELRKFEPHGPANHSPVFAFMNAREKGYGRRVGNNHLKIDISNDGSNFVACIGFGMDTFLPLVSGGRTFDLAGSLEENVYNGRSSPQVKIKDIRASA
jgi:single-stranded-DNA-specific exonuclease